MDKRIIEETPSSEVLNDDWFIKDSPTGGTSKILGSNLKDIISGDVENAIDKILDSIAPEWSPTTTYGFDSYVIHEGELWRCFKDTGSTVGEFKTSEWIKAVTSGYITHVINKIADRFVASNPPFMIYRYSVGDMVFYSEPYHDEQLYVCNTDLPQGESTFNPEHWDVVYTVAGLSKYLTDKIAEAGQIDDVQVKTTGDYESVVDENKVAKIDLSNMLIEKSVPNLPQSVATFNDGSDLPLKSLTVSIEPVQAGSGDPSPTNVRPISGWSGVNIEQCRYNVLKLNEGASFSPNYRTISVENGEIKYVITATIGMTQIINSAGISALFYSQKLKPATYTFTLETDLNDNASLFKLKLTDGTEITSNSTFTLSEEKTIDSIITSQSITKSSGTYYIKLQLLVGTTDTSYHAYNGTTTTIPFVDGQGQSVEVYGGSVDVINGGEQPRTLGSVDMGDMNWTYSDSGNYFTGTIQGCIIPTIYSDHKPICEAYKGRNPNYINVLQNGEVMYNTTFGAVFVKDSNYTDATEFKSAVSGIKLVYELATPTTFYTHPTSIKSIDGENNVFADTGEIKGGEYIADASLVIANLDARITALENA